MYNYIHIYEIKLKFLVKVKCTFWDKSKRGLKQCFLVFNENKAYLLFLTKHVLQPFFTLVEQLTFLIT